MLIPIKCICYAAYLQNILMIVLLLLPIVMLVSPLPELYSLTNEYEVTNKISQLQLAHAYFDVNDRKTGWNSLYIYANQKASEMDQHKAVGFLEGYATYSQIYSAFVNFCGLDFDGNREAPEKVQRFMDQQLDYIDFMVRQNPDDIFWRYTGYYLEQVRYMHAGYMIRIKKQKLTKLQLTFSQIYYLTSIGDLEDLLAIVDEKDRQKKNCNAYVSLLNGELYVTHGTHNRYPFLLRIFKTWSFPRVGLPMQSTSFTSRPGDLISKDDFFLLSSGLRVLETSLQNFKRQNLKELRPTTVPSWLRTVVANHLSSSNEEWIQYFLKQRSGTHNNQWMLINPMRLESKTGVIHFIDEAFSLYKVFDMTQLFFQQGYIASYNMPYSQQIYAKLDYGFKYNATYQTDIRGLILKEYHPKMLNEEDMKYWLINNEEKNVTKGLAPRYDLYQTQPGVYLKAFGMTDCKIASPSSLKQNYFWAISGPPTSNGRFPPFEWTNFQSSPREGLQPKYDFGWQKIPLDLQLKIRLQV